MKLLDVDRHTLDPETVDVGLEQFVDLRVGLVGHEPEADLGHGVIGQDGFGALPGYSRTTFR